MAPNTEQIWPVGPSLLPPGLRHCARISADSPTIRSQRPFQFWSLLFPNEFLKIQLDYCVPWTFSGFSWKASSNEISKSQEDPGSVTSKLSALGQLINLSVPQFPHLYVTWSSSLNTLWAKVKSPDSLMLVPPSQVVSLVPVKAPLSDFWGSHLHRQGQPGTTTVQPSLMPWAKPTHDTRGVQPVLSMMMEGGCLGLSIVHC